MLLYFSASYAGRIAPPGYPNTVVTPCCSRHSQSICAPVFIISFSAWNRLSLNHHGIETHPNNTPCEQTHPLAVLAGITQNIIQENWNLRTLSVEISPKCAAPGPSDQSHFTVEVRLLLSVQLQVDTASHRNAFEHRKRMPGILRVFQTGNHGLRRADFPSEFRLGHTSVFPHFANK